MTTTLLKPAQWAEAEFASVELGDRRRTQRLVKIATRLAENPGGTMPQALPEWSQLKAAYHFFGQPKNTFDKIQSAHWEKTREACRAPGQYLLIEDTSELDYTGHPATEDMGTIGNGHGRGLLLHTTLAMRIDGWDAQDRPEGIVLGLFGQQCWSRHPHGRKRETRRQLMSRARESQRWAAVLEEVGGPPQGSQWVYLGDREGDFYEPIQRCQRWGVDFIIRAFHDRLVSGGEAHLKEQVARAAVCGQLDVELRGREGRAARTAKVEVRAVRMSLNGPYRNSSKQPDFQANVVEVREVGAPEGVEALHWLLLSSLPCSTWAQVRRVVRLYGMRWCVEEYHKALKSGAGVEDSQMEEAYRVESLIAVLGVVAVRLVNTKWLARTRPDEPVDPEVFGGELLEILTAKFGQPEGGWTHRRALIAVARVGGFLARRSDGMPGWQTIWRGWQRLICQCEGLESLKMPVKRCG